MRWIDHLFLDMIHEFMSMIYEWDIVPTGTTDGTGLHEMALGIINKVEER